MTDYLVVCTGCGAVFVASAVGIGDPEITQMLKGKLEVGMTCKTCGSNRTWRLLTSLRIPNVISG